MLFVIQLIPVHEFILGVGLKHTLGFMYLVAEWVSAEVCEIEGGRGSVPRQTPPLGAIIILKEFYVAAGTGTVGHELCVSFRNSGTSNMNNSLLINFTGPRGLKIAGSWYLRPKLHRCREVEVRWRSIGEDAGSRPARCYK